MRLLIAGGGTGGHVYPLVAVFEELKKKLSDEKFEILYIGSRGGIEGKIFKNYNIPSFFIFSGKWRRYWYKWFPAFLLNIRDLFLITVGFFQAFIIIAKFRPEVLFAKGGYVTVPVVFAAKICGVPIITHESDIVVGISNKIAARMAKKICVSFPLHYFQNLPKAKLVYTGNPIRKEFFDNYNIQKKNRPTLLVIGGSQGSEIINQSMYGIIPKIIQDIDIIHITGKSKDNRAQEVKSRLLIKLQNHYQIFDFLDKELPKTMHRADLIVSRAGANTLAEISASGKPSILIPLKNAASDHQSKNANLYNEKNAAFVIKEDDLDKEILQNTILKLLSNQEMLRKMAENSKSLSEKDAAEKIADEVIKLRR